MSVLPGSVGSLVMITMRCTIYTLYVKQPAGAIDSDSEQLTGCHASVHVSLKLLCYM